MYYDLFDYSDRVAGENGEAFADLPYMHDLCEALERCVVGDLPDGKQNLLITIPPRHYKTTFTSQNFVAWCLAEVAPDCQFILTSYAAELATTNCMAVKRILQQEWHKEQYPNTRIARNEKDLQKYFRTTAGGSVYATGMEGSITGFGAGKTRRGFGGAIIIDDPLKASDATSATMLENSVRYYLSTLKSRRNNAAATPIILIMQRLHVDDLAGWVLKNEPDYWYHVSFPALTDGKVLNSVTTTVEELELMKAVDPVTFYGQYQQCPIVPGGNIIKLDWWSTYDPVERRPDGLRYITADTAFKEHDDNDQSVLQCWEATEQGLYFIDAMYGRWDFPRLLSNATAFYRVCGQPREFWIEDKASGTPLEQMMSDNGLPARAWKPAAFAYPDDKVGRMQAASWIVHGGKVFLPRGNVPVRISDDRTEYLSPGAAALMEEAAMFSRDMSHKHDDHCDAFTMAVSLYQDLGGKA
jgi:predicted phage terminase large subunit-like protein